jgi:plastocyanin
LATPLVALAANPEFELTIKDHRFSPAELRVPAGKKIKLIVQNQDATAEEFESKALHLEKVVAPKSKAAINIGPLKAGQYPFVGEYNEATARGTIIAE